MSPRVLITGARSAVALDMARDFRHAGYDVHMADCASAFIARWSRAPGKVHRYASPVRKPSQFVADISAIVQAVDPALVIPTCEEVFHLARLSLQPILQNRLFSPSFEQLHSLHAKGRFMELCRQAGIPVPESHVVNTPDDLAAYADCSQEWVFKPCYSRFGAQTLISPTREALRRIVPGAGYPWLAQRRIHGQEYSFYAVAHNGRVVACAAYHSSWRLGGGASYAFSPAEHPIAGQVNDLAQHIASHIGLTGQFSCDLIVDDKGQIWPIECNPRATSGLHFLCEGGALARAIATASTASHSLQPRYMLPMMLSRGLLSSTWRGWWNMMRDGRDVIGAKGDRLPLTGALADTALFALRARWQGISLPEATTVDIEWNGETLL